MPNDHIPVFLDRTFSMIEQVPDDIVCWSTAGSSFIVKQVGARELPVSVQGCADVSAKIAKMCGVFFVL